MKCSYIIIYNWEIAELLNNNSVLFLNTAFKKQHPATILLLNVCGQYLKFKEYKFSF